MSIASNEYIIAELVEHQLYDHKVTDLGTHIEVRKYKQRLVRLNPDFTPDQNIMVDDNGEPYDQAHEDKQITKRGSLGSFEKRSIIKSFNNICGIASLNHEACISFITLTFEDNITDLNLCNRIFNDTMWKLRKRCKKIGIDFKYIGVPEFQTRGAIHYHLMTNIPCGCEMMPKRAKKVVKNDKRHSVNKYVDLYYYGFDWWPDPDTRIGLSEEDLKKHTVYGWATAFGLSDVDSKFSVTGYIASYFWKNVDKVQPSNQERVGTVDLRLYNRIKVLRSRNLKTPDPMYLDSMKDDQDLKLKLIDLENVMIQEREVISTSRFVPDVKISKYYKNIL